MHMERRMRPNNTNRKISKTGKTKATKIRTAAKTKIPGRRQETILPNQNNDKTERRQPRSQ